MIWGKIAQIYLMITIIFALASFVHAVAAAKCAFLGAKIHAIVYATSATALAVGAAIHYRRYITTSRNVKYRLKQLEEKKLSILYSP